VSDTQKIYSEEQNTSNDQKQGEILNIQKETSLFYNTIIVQKYNKEEVGEGCIP